MFIQLIRFLIPDSIFLWFRHEADAAQHKQKGLGDYPVSTNDLIKRVVGDAKPVKKRVEWMTEDDVRSGLLLVVEDGLKATKRKIVETKGIPNVKSYTRHKSGGR